MLGKDGGSGGEWKFAAALASILIAVMGFFFQVSLRNADATRAAEKDIIGMRADIRYLRESQDRVEKAVERVEARLRAAGALAEVGHVQSAR